MYTQEQFDNAHATDLLPLECRHCKSVFKRKKAHLQVVLAGKSTKKKADYCSRSCVGASQSKKVEVTCDQCGSKFTKALCVINKTKHNFCNRSCSGTYHNAHRTYGYRRSKLEIWLEQQLKNNYKDLEIHFNRREAINSELDIYFPSLKLAFELNGIFHYEPIYGQKTLANIKNNDGRKFQACLEKGIELCVIDASQFRYFKPGKADKYLDIVRQIVDLKLKPPI